MEIIIRAEKTADYAEVEQMVKAAFVTAEHSDGDEHNLVARLRNSKDFVPELSLVAEKNGRIVGHILFTKLRCGGKILLAMAPLAIAPDCQRQGIGKQLIAAGHAIGAKVGFGGSVVLGDPKVYGKSGYEPASKWGIKAPFEVPSEYFMAIELLPDGLKNAAGVVDYAKEFGIA